VTDSQGDDDLSGNKLAQKRNLVILLGGKAKESNYQKIITKMGSRHIEDLNERFDVYVTDEKLVRNSKLLLAIATGASIVSVKWLEDSQKKGKLITEGIEKYHIIDQNFEKQYSCSLKKLYLENRSSTLLKDKHVYVSPNIVGISKQQMA
jgi:BRCA1 C Terminus (BRCT) domain